MAYPPSLALRTEELIGFVLKMPRQEDSALKSGKPAKGLGASSEMWLKAKKNSHMNSTMQ